MSSLRDSLRAVFKYLIGLRGYVHFTELNQHWPASSGSAKDLASLTLLSSEQTFPLLEALLNDQRRQVVQPITFTAFAEASRTSRSARTLGSLFEQYGSDKSTRHNYHWVYGDLLDGRRDAPLRLLEVGMGTNHADVASHMGAAGRPGASLRAFRDFLPNAQIVGADIDRRILFEEDRITSFYVDQTSMESFAALGVAVGSEPFDLIIDDGLHSPNANLATLRFALAHLRPGGTVVIEDIPERSLPIWTAVSAMLSSRGAIRIVTAPDGCLFVLTTYDE
jgi:hypothetical protein